jgi:hypothetical protein
MCLPLWIFRSLFILLCAVPTGIVARQESPAGGQPERLVQTQMRNVTFRFSENVTVQIKSLNGALVPVGTNEIPIFDDKDSFNLRIDSAEVSMDTSNLANALNSYVFARPDSPLTQLSVAVDKGHLKVKGKLHGKKDIPFDTEGNLIPTEGGKLRLHCDKIKALHVPVKGLMALLGIDLGKLIQEGKVSGVTAQEDDLILDLEKILPAPHIEGKVVSVRIEGNNIIQIFGGFDTKPVKNMRAGNYMAFKHNRLRFGKLLMNDADLILIDMDSADPLDFFLEHYREQLSAGYTKLTAESGLRVYVRDYNKLHPAKASTNDKNQVPSGSPPPSRIFTPRFHAVSLLIQMLWRPLSFISA